MNTIKDFLTSLKDRFTNPFVFSFCVAWVVFNYKISLALLFYELKKDNYTSFIELIDKNTDRCTMIWWPIITAGLYILVFTVLQELIRAFKTIIERKSDSWIYSKTHKTTVKMSEHMDIELRYKKVLDEYKTLITGQIETQETNVSLTSDIEKLTKELEKAKGVNSANENLIATQEGTIANLKRQIDPSDS